MRRSAILVLPLLFAFSAAAQEILTNSGFATSLGGWTPDTVAGSASWSALDAVNSPSSGSALLTSTGAPAGSSEGISQCVLVTPGVAYEIRMFYRVPSAQATTGSQNVQMAWYSGAGCGGSFLGGEGTGSAIISVPDGWNTLGDVSTPPAGTASARFTAFVRKDQAGGSYQAYLDEIVVGPIRTATIPASASIHGQNGAFFHTDLWLVNRSQVYNQSLTLRHRCPAGQTCGTAAKTFSIFRNSALLLTDVLASLFADVETSGAIEIAYDSGVSPLVALSRTYSPTLPSPTSGSTLPALAPDQAVSLSVLPGLGANGGSLSSGFRTNVGAYNPNDAPVTATFTLFSASGAPLGSPVVATLAPREPLQVNDVFLAAGVGGTVTSNAYAVVTATAPVFSYATVIDNQSGDSVIVTGTPDR